MRGIPYLSLPGQIALEALVEEVVYITRNHSDPKELPPIAESHRIWHFAAEEAEVVLGDQPWGEEDMANARAKARSVVRGHRVGGAYAP